MPGDSGVDRRAVVPMDGPVLVFGGPYSNLEATQAVLAAAAARGIPPRRIVCTGDIVAYGADAAATLAAVRAAGIWAVMGNCEESLGSGAGDCGCGYAEGSACDRLAVEWYAHAERRLDGDARRWMAALPRRLDIELAGRRLGVIHGGVRQINRFIFASTPAAVKREDLAAAGCDGVIAGHCGMPANDATPATWFSILTPRADGIAIAHHALAYDHRAAAAKMRAARLPEGYAGALESGLWPSLDVLPAAELDARGAALRPGGVLWRGASTGDRGETWPAPAGRAPARPL